jgi:hypothetical protein
MASVVSIRPRYVGDCAGAGWTALGAGRRAAVDGLCVVPIASRLSAIQIAMLQLMWPNPDRDGDLHVRHTPSIEESRAVVQLAVTIVQWARDGQIAEKSDTVSWELTGSGRITRVRNMPLTRRIVRCSTSVDP